MKAPGFWSNDRHAPGLLSTALMPISALWSLGARMRSGRAMPERVDAPVLCVGNLTAGGAGKSPMVAALQNRLAGQGCKVHVVSRGYGGRTVGPHLVDERKDRFQDVGDEPLMLAANGPVWVSRDRAAGARAAVAAGADLILLDDGFQNPGLHKDASVLMVDAGQGFGNGRVIPAGPLREPVSQGLSRADLALVLGPGDQRTACRETWPELQSLTSLDAELIPQQTGLPLEDEDVMAFAGIGRPQKFFDTLRGMGANLVATHAFADHQPFPPAILRRLLKESREASAVLVTTEKDAVRLPRSMRMEVLTVQVRLEPVDWAPIDALVQRLLAQGGSHRNP
jgi:tetraacyldisaccharide 4'-kinase